MQIFIDTADINEIRDLNETGLIDGVTTNPSLAASQGIQFTDLIRQICDIVDGPISAEVIALDAAGMIEQGKKLAGIHENVVIKVPLTVDGLKACYALAEDDIAVNVTLCFSAPQALLAAKAGARYISPFVGRLDDQGWDGMQLIRDIQLVYDNYMFDTEILAASIRHPQHVLEAAKAGADVCTIPPKVFRQLYKHNLTDIGLDAFMADWKKSGLSI
ncbi:fructose-6-phosphate aldolase [Candidatus Odyssella acanthamoebae]|uniref:Probable transaldolase n=1 Tax=Candidatus Odyssella acanthamoebae TaxID=91604 RepID=A0A077AVU3_9PROT|nr:fructose-6-phosphate aldolase [Candidatus Paracaedibacter acanthamoebae]AIK97267.1 transaldolase [Candidatus Paracaedibacter acanthamoebae]